MFFMSVFYFMLVVGAVYVAWRFIIKPALKAQGVEVDDPEVDPLTAMEVKRDRLQSDLEKLTKDAKAADAMAEMTGEITALKNQIANAEAQIKEIKKSS